MGCAVNENSDISEVIWVGQVELHSCTAHWDVSGAQFSGGSSDVGRGCTISAARYNSMYIYTVQVATPTWYGDLLRFRRDGAVLVNDSDSNRVGPWIKGCICTTTDGSGQVGNRKGLLSCLTSAERRR